MRMGGKVGKDELSKLFKHIVSRPDPQGKNERDVIDPDFPEAFQEFNQQVPA